MHHIQQEPALNEAGSSPGEPPAASSGTGPSQRLAQLSQLNSAELRTEWRRLVRAGPEPLSTPGLYTRLLEIYSSPAEARKAHALRFCGPLAGAKIQIVDALDPALLDPQIIAKIGSVGRAHQINAILRVLREICSTTSDADFIQSFISTPRGIETAAQHWFEKADRFPEPPFRDVPGLTPLSTAQAMIDTASEMKNCLRSKISESVLGYSYCYRAEVEIPPSGLTPVVVEILPLSGGFWRVAGVHGPRRRSLPPHVQREVLKPLLEQGALISTTTRPDAKSLGHALSGYRWDAYYLPDDEEEENEEEQTEDELV